jgi:membrane protease YdiL (CAAX protease family)
MAETGLYWSPDERQNGRSWDKEKDFMTAKLDLRRIGIYLAFAFGIAWAAGIAVYFLGGITAPASVALMATVYMWAPALGNLLTRWITREGLQNIGLKANFRRGWPLWIAAWVLPALLTILGLVIYFLILPQYYDPNLTMLRKAIGGLAIDPWAVVALQIVQAILLAPIINGISTFGEEFGWRGYLLPKLLPLGSRKAVLVLGVIWGAWHWPLTVQGHNYGFGYFGAPWTGMLTMLVFTTVLGIFLAWVTLRSGSIWPAVIGHAAVNGIAGLGVMFAQGSPSPLLGPIAAGLIGGMGFLLFAVLLFFHPTALQPREGNAFPPHAVQAATFAHPPANPATD